MGLCKAEAGKDSRRATLQLAARGVAKSGVPGSGGWARGSSAARSRAARGSSPCARPSRGSGRGFGGRLGWPSLTIRHPGACTLGPDLREVHQAVLAVAVQLDKHAEGPHLLHRCGARQAGRGRWHGEVMLGSEGWCVGSGGCRTGGTGSHQQGPYTAGIAHGWTASIGQADCMMCTKASNSGPGFRAEQRAARPPPRWMECSSGGWSLSRPPAPPPPPPPGPPRPPVTQTVA